MIVHVSLVQLLCLLVLAFPAQGRELSTAERGELPLEALLGDRIVFDHWLNDFGNIFRNKLNEISNVTPNNVRIIAQKKRDGIDIYTIAFEYHEHSPLRGKIGGGILAVPKRIVPSWPLIVAIHGHEHPQWGHFPEGLFSDGSWPLELAESGFAVWAPVSMQHAEIETIAHKHGYLPVWVKTISEGLDSLSSLKIPRLLYSGYAALGVSAGGQTAYTLMAYRKDIRIGVFAGAQQPLDFLRREYHLKNHPKCWDIPWLTSYTAIQASIAPRPIEFQLGMQDPWFPSGEPFPKHGDWFPGTSRDVLSDEIGGQALMLRTLWKYKGGGVVTHYLHKGGHEMDVNEAIRFLTTQMKQ